MKHTNDTRLHVMQRGDDLEERDPMDELNKKIKRHRKRFWQRTISTLFVLAMVIAGTWMMLEFQSHTKVQVLNTYKTDGTNGGSYVEFAGGALKYSKDGVSLVDYKGKEVWNQPGQVKNPIADTMKKAAVVADRGGNAIMVFNAKGLKGEIHTTLPIEKVAVSGQGIVGVILKDESTPRVICYDAAGNILAEQKTSLAGTGYPIGIAVSEDGNTLLVTYLRVESGIVTSKVSYYHFKDVPDGEASHQAEGEDFADEITASVFFMDKQTSAAVSDRSVMIYKSEKPSKADVKIKIEKEIKGVAHSNKYIGLVLKNKGQINSELRLYNKSGKEVLSKEFTGDYGNIKISGNRVVMYEGKKCVVFKASGVKEFEGEFVEEVLEIVPIRGINKYIVMNANGMEQVRFVK